MDRIDRNGTLGHEEVLEEVEIHLNALARSFPELPNTLYRQHLRQAEINVERLVSNANITQILKDRLTNKINELNDKYRSLTVDGGKKSNDLPSKYNIKEKKNKAGNSRYLIDKEHLEFLIGIGHNVSEIAKKGLLGGVMHRNTLTNFMRKNNIKSVKDRYTSLQDSEIKNIIREITRLFPNSGIREVDSMLKTRNPPVIVQRDKVQRLMSEINPVATTRRWAQVIPRRTYSVPTPNSLWHIDTHHSLIR